MEHDVVLADKVDKACVGILPPGLPAAALGMSVAELLGVADIADGGIEPYVQHLTLGTFYRNGDTPVQVTAHGTGLQTHVKPALALTVYVRTPLLVLLKNPLLKPLLILFQRQVPVCGLLHHGLAAAYGAYRVDKLGGRE